MGLAKLSFIGKGSDFPPPLPDFAFSVKEWARIGRALDTYADQVEKQDYGDPDRKAIEVEEAHKQAEKIRLGIPPIGRH